MNRDLLPSQAKLPQKVERPTRSVRKSLLLATTGIAFLLWLWITVQTYLLDNLGFASKTYWDWMQLFLVPAALAAAGFWFSRVQKATEIEIARDNRQQDLDLAQDKRAQEMLDRYFDRMSALLLEQNLRAAKPDANPAKLATTLTLNILRGLDSRRNQQVIQFLRDTELLGRSQIINMRGAQLSGVDLAGANLALADLSYADLSGSNLRRAYLNKAILRDVKLAGANLTDARLTDADLQGADLADALLEGVDLESTKGLTLIRS